MENKKITITTAIDYVNSLPHIGTAYEKIGADVLARFYRMQGYDVLFHMGNDEHSANVLKAAADKGLEPLAYCTAMRKYFEEIWKKLSISYNSFIQTTEPRHHVAVKKLFQLIHASGDIYLKDYEGWYCESCEAFYTEKDLVEGLCPNHKQKPKWLKEKNYHFKLSRHADFLLEHIRTHPNFILPEKRKNEIVQFIRAGLADISVSRSSFSWGITLPIAKEQVVYVWFDALINYITALGFGADSEDFSQRWHNVLHVVGKDITRFHCIIWPAMLKSAGLALPDCILGHGFVYLKGEKMSKTLGNVVTPLDILDKYPVFGADALRYYLMRGSSFGADGDFTWEGFIARYNSDLANGLGNFVSRTMGMVWRYQAGAVEALPPTAQGERGLLQSLHAVCQEQAKFLDPRLSGDACFHFALEKIWVVLASFDQFIDQRAPWTLFKEKKMGELSIVLTTLVEAVRGLCVLLFAYMPTAMAKVWEAFGFEEDLEGMTYESLAVLPYIKDKHVLKEDRLTLFPRIETVL